MTIVTVRRATINLGDIQLDVFQMADGSYQLSERGCEVAVCKTERSIRNFLRGKSPQALQYKGFNPGKLSVEGEPMKINGIPFELAVAYWTKEAMGGNFQAVALLGACAAEALERRADKVFAVEKSEESRNTDLANFIFKWQMTRQMARNSHAGFAEACIKKHHPGNLVHDYMTVLIFGDTAKAARMKALVSTDLDLDPTIGLNHQSDIDGMLKVANAKTSYIRMTKGTWQQQVERAVAKTK